MCGGCPQGSICGPALWNMIMDGLLEEIGRRERSCVAYADDLLYMIEADNRNEIEDVGTEVMEMVLRGMEWVSRSPGRKWYIKN